MQKNAEQFMNLTPKQQLAITALLTSPTIKEASEKASVSERVLYKWLKQDNFKACLDESRAIIQEEALNGLKMALTDAVSVLTQMLKAESDFIKLRSATQIIDYCLKVRESELFDSRLSELEREVDRWTAKREG